MKVFCRHLPSFSATTPYSIINGGDSGTRTRGVGFLLAKQVLSPLSHIPTLFNFGGRLWNRTRIARASAERLDHIGQTSMVGVPGVEPGTLSVSETCANQLRHTPDYSILVEAPGVEPGTYGLKIRYSFPLSYASMEGRID